MQGIEAAAGNPLLCAFLHDSDELLEFEQHVISLVRQIEGHRTSALEQVA